MTVNMRHTNTAAITIDLRAAHYQLGIDGLYAILATLAGRVVSYTDDDGSRQVGRLVLGVISEGDYLRRETSDGPVLTDQRRGFTFIVQLGDDFVARGVWEDHDTRELDLAALGRGATIKL